MAQSAAIGFFSLNLTFADEEKLLKTYNTLNCTVLTANQKLK
jgi:hypothetical protein